MIRTEEEHLAHYGILRRSGRYPWGSGGILKLLVIEAFLISVEILRKRVCLKQRLLKVMDITTTELRAAKIDCYC